MIRCIFCGKQKNHNDVRWLSTTASESIAMCADYCGTVDPRTCRHEDHLALCKRCTDGLKR